MARRKRASMREGPLADLFRSTTDDANAEPPEFKPGDSDTAADDQDVAPTEPSGGTQFHDEGSEPEPQRDDAPTHGTPDPSAAGRFGRNDPVADSPGRPPSPARREPPAEPEPQPDPLSAPNPAADMSNVPDAQDRLKRIFSEQPAREDSPRYGRQEPSIGAGGGVPHSPVIRVVGVGGGGVNAINRMIEAQIPGVEFMAEIGRAHV